MRQDQIAARTWDQDRSLQETSNVIHDGAQGEADLLDRSRGYVSGVLLGNFPQAVPAAGASILEIGSGLGWIMQAMSEFLRERAREPQQILGLDIAPSMIRQAQQRVGPDTDLGFVLYDGVTVPLPDATLDLVYSVAALQHIPRPFVYNIFFEIARILKPMDGRSFISCPRTPSPSRRRSTLGGTKYATKSKGIRPTGIIFIRLRSYATFCGLPASPTSASGTTIAARSSRAFPIRRFSRRTTSIQQPIYV